MNEKDQLNLVMANVNNFNRIKDPCDQVLIYIIKKGFIKLFDWKSKEISLNVQLALISSSPYHFFLINNPFEETVLLSLEKNGMIIKEIKNQTMQMHEVALKNNPSSFVHFKNPSYDICLKAVNLREENLVHVDNPTIDFLKLVINKNWASFQYLKAIPYSIQSYIIEKYTKMSDSKKKTLIKNINRNTFCARILNIHNCSGFFIVDLYSRLGYEELKAHKNWKSSAKLILMKVKINKAIKS